MKPKDFILFVEGYNRRVLDMAELLRIHSFRVAQFEKPVTYDQYKSKYWPLPGDDDNGQRKQRLIDKLKRIKNNGNGRS